VHAVTPDRATAPALSNGHTLQERSTLRLSASIVTFRSDVRLFRALSESLIGALERARRDWRIDADLIVVINDTRDEDIATIESAVEEIRAIAPEYIRLRIVKGHGNIGYGAGQNLAIETVSSDYHLILNPDVFLEKDALQESLSYLDEHAEVAMLVPQGFDAQNEYARLSKRHPSLLVLLLRALAVRSSDGVLGRRVGRYTYSGELPCDAPKSITLASGCFMLCRTEILKKVNGFDERYFLYFEDYDLSLRVKNYGAIVELPQARITHYGGHTARRDLRRVAHFLRSGVRFFNRYGWRIV
jgi:GT2 family glycosyltransferase